MSYKTKNLGRVSERLEAPERYAGYRVYDPAGRKVGSAKELFVNTHDEPEYVMVKIGLFGLRSVLIPVQVVTVDEDQRSLVLH